MALTQGDRVSDSVHLPSGWCSPNDSLRAFLCAEAVLRPQNSDIEAFLRGIQKEFPFIEFGDIHMSVDLNPDYGCKFLVADAADAIFIAFHVSQNFNNNSLGSALCLLPSGGQVDSAVFTLSHDLKILTDIYGFHEGKRIVFCGHEFGGALAHMLVLQFLAPLFKSRDKALKEMREMISMISIAFGAPCICSGAYAEEVNGNKELKSHFFDFVHEHDPRRSILSTENAGRGRNLEVVKVGIFNFLGVSGPVNKVPLIGKAAAQMKRAYNSANFKTCEEPKFFPIGKNFVLKGSNPSSSNPWSRDTFFNSYKSALILKLALPTTKPLQSHSNPLQKLLQTIHSLVVSESKPSDPNSKLVLRVTTPTPEIKSAKLKAMDSGSFVHVEGSNLLFLREPVKVNGLNPWICKIQKDNELYLFEPPQTGVKTEANDMENALSFIVLKTAFGEASHLISENSNMSGGSPTGVCSLLFKIVQTFVALASAPLCITQSSELLEDLDSIVQCAPGLKDERLSKVLKEIAHGNADEDLKENITKINTTVEKVVEFLTRSYKIEYNTPPVKLGSAALGSAALGVLLVLGGLITSPLSLVVSGLTFFTAATGASVASGFVAFFLSNRELVIPDYHGMLKIAIQEAQLWHDEGQASDFQEKTEAPLESLLLEEVKRSGSRLTDMMERIHKSGAKAQDIVFRSPIFRGATLESKANLLRRMQIVTKTLHMYNTRVKDIRFVGVVGAEDAGKSTFIRKAVGHFEGKPYSELSDSGLPDVGFDCHTTTVRAYKLRSEENLYLVDFPGSNGTGAYADAWKQFTSLPSSCVLLLDFKDDMKQDQVDMYRKMKDDLGSKVSVVFNKVDEKFTPHKEAYYNVDYFNKQRVDTANMLECDKADVHFSCLYPDPEDKLIKLKKAGVLDFEELFEKVVTRLARGTFCSGHLEHSASA